MDPLGHLAPWLFKDMIEKENGLLQMPYQTNRGLTDVDSGYPPNNR